MSRTQILDWKETDYANHQEATLSNPDGSVGVRFSLEFLPTCYRRGKHKLLIEVLPTPFHHAWGCFDAQDQPMRWYHSVHNAKDEAQRIASVLFNDFKPERSGREMDAYLKDFVDSNL